MTDTLHAIAERLAAEAAQWVHMSAEQEEAIAEAFEGEPWLAVMVKSTAYMAGLWPSCKCGGCKPCRARAALQIAAGEKH